VWGEPTAAISVAVLGTSADMIEECSKHLEKMSWVETHVLSMSPRAILSVPDGAAATANGRRDSLDKERSAGGDTNANGIDIQGRRSRSDDTTSSSSFDEGNIDGFMFSPSNMSFGMSPPHLVHSMSPITKGVWKKFLNDVDRS